MERNTEKTELLDFDAPEIQALIEARGWRHLPEAERIRQIHDYMRDEIRFGYNVSDDVPASTVLKDGYGQCNTKSTLLMALLRAVDIPCRLHGFLVHKSVQAGIVPSVVYRLAPEQILHSWVEVLHEGQWLELEGIILDERYLEGVQKAFPEVRGAFCGYGVATQDLRAPPIYFRGSSTHVQKEAISQDLGIFDSPDEFYRQHGANLVGWRQVVYAHVVRKLMNDTVEQIRQGHSLPGDLHPHPLSQESA